MLKKHGPHLRNLKQRCEHIISIVPKKREWGWDPKSIHHSEKKKTADKSTDWV